MPAIGTTKISKQKKAMIIAEKRVGTGTSRDIAKKYGVAVQTVRNIGSADRPVSREILVMAETLESRILAQARTNLEAGLLEIGRRVVDPNERLSSIVHATRLSYEVYQNLSEKPDPNDERAAMLLESIRKRAEEKGVPFESEIANYVANYSHTISIEVRTRIQMALRGELAAKSQDS